MKRLLRFAGFVVGAALLATQVAAAVSLPLELRQNEVPVNFQSARGVPISTTLGVPVGSDGRAPTPGQQSADGLTTTQPNGGQFGGLVSFGAVQGRTATESETASSSAALNGGTTPFSSALALQMALPVGTSNNAVVIVMRRASVGAPYLSKQVSFLFGSVVEVPSNGDDDRPLPSTIRKEDYWIAEPYSTNHHGGSGYYWSPHARRVYAIQAGPLSIIWKRATGSSTQPPDFATDPTQYVVESGTYYRLYTARYVVSGGSVKPSKKIFWTQGAFASTGKPVPVPDGQVGRVNVIYNSNFPEKVAEEFTDVGQSRITDVGNTLQELRTLWYDTDQKQIFAYNREGRVFVELLGDTRADGSTRIPLGFEVVDVLKQPSPEDVTTELGDLLLPPASLAPKAPLIPSPLSVLPTRNYARRHNVAGSDVINFYAITETINVNDYQVFWLETGVAGLNWPAGLGRYRLIWPTDIGRYSHYVRPQAATETEAMATSVPLSTQNLPTIEYQDPMDRPRAKLTQDFKFYSFLDEAHPIHRTLVSFVSGENIAFERVLSILNTEVRNPTREVGSLTQASLLLRPDAQAHGSLPVGTYFEGGSFSVEAWVNLKSHNPNQRLVDFGNGPGADNVFVALSDGSSGKPKLGIVRGGVEQSITATNALTLGGWVHLSVTYDSSSITGSIYVNGILDGIGSLHPPEAVVRTRNLIGRSNNDTDSSTDAAIDTLRVWSVVRSPNEIVAGMNSTYPGGTPGLQAQFLFSEDTGDGGITAVDSSGKGHTMALIGTSLSNLLTRPRYYSGVVNVGDRIVAPPAEVGALPTDTYLPGHIRLSEGTSFSTTAYIDPLGAGFAEAVRGAIIPVNSIPGFNTLEVWWFRGNGADLSKGFQTVHWPSIVGRYTVEWPTHPREIVLASNRGSGPLNSLEAKGGIYYQNDRALPGFNPNEEHAMMQGGQAWALRDDLNVIDGGEFTSLPYVLLQYIAPDGRPAISAFKVLREKPEEGLVFNYIVDAGTILQPPMPLPLLEKPFAPKPLSGPRRSLNEEVEHRNVASNPGAADGTEVSLNTLEFHQFEPFAPLFLQDTRVDPPVVLHFLPTSTGDDPPSLAGIVSSNSPSALSPWLSHRQPTNLRRLRYFYSGRGGAQSSPQDGETVAIVNSSSNAVTAATIVGFHTFLATEVVELPLFPTPALVQMRDAELASVGKVYVEIEFEANATPTETFADSLWQPVPEAIPVNALRTWKVGPTQLPAEIPSAAIQELYASYTFQDRKGNTWIYRGPHSESDSGSMSMQYYYRTQAGFFFPSLPVDKQPDVGTITPYLRPLLEAGGYYGNPIYGDENADGIGDQNSLAVQYRPRWPSTAPVLFMGESLELPKRGLPSIRGQRSLQILYQQSQATASDGAGDLSLTSAFLHDPTREKTFGLAGSDSSDTLSKVPPSVKTQDFRGKTYFPNLPPHLAERFFLDPARGEHGALVFQGRFVDAPVGDDYLLLNVLGTQDKAYLMDLCLVDDPKKELWDAAIEGLSTELEKFVENPSKPGTYFAGSSKIFGPDDLVVVEDGDEAVDSYALSAAGPGVGYLTLIAGNGQAFTPEAEPVSMHIVRVVDTLYRGEVKVVDSSNPLNERVSFQQVTDLGNAFDQYEFEWKIAAPVDGAPPLVYQNTRSLLMGDGVWNHVPYPLGTDNVSSIQLTSADRLTTSGGTSLVLHGLVGFSGSTVRDGKLVFAAQGHHLAAGNRVLLRTSSGTDLLATVDATSTNDELAVIIEDTSLVLEDLRVLRVSEAFQEGSLSSSMVFRDFSVPSGSVYSSLWLSLDLDPEVQARVYLDGQPVATLNFATDNTPPSSAPSTLIPLKRVFQINPQLLANGSPNGDGASSHRVAVELFSSAVPGTQQVFNLRLEAFSAADLVNVAGSQWLTVDPTRHVDGVRMVLGGTADVRSLSDNYVIMRYRAKDPGHVSFAKSWSQWTEPQLAEGWIKRVLKGINPFNQRVGDLFNNRVNTDVSILTQAGPRWEGDVALNQDTLNNYGLIEIYETVARRGKMLSIGAGINYGPANDALLLVTGYLNDLYMMLGNEAWTDAANPTIGIGTKDKTYGDVATALFAFKGQVPSLLDEELALLRGRDDFLQPGVETPPVYNRLFWNYTRGIDSGEVIYALNYNIQENADTGVNGVIDADDARHMFPQGHGDAYGHYLTGLKGYLSLMLDTDFDWVPKSEAVTVLGKPVQVDYQDERKFTSAAAAFARAGRQVFDLTWRKDYQPGRASGWNHLSQTRENLSRGQVTTRFWGADHWASRTAQGAYVSWIVGNAILPAVDPDPAHEGIQKIDRTTVPELQELGSIIADVQTSIDSAEGGLNPLGLSGSSVAFDVNPNRITGTNPETHFEQIYDRARGALGNAVVAFDDAKNVTQLLRSEQDSLVDLQAKVADQELAYENSLIEIYGTPYSDDIGAGKTYPQGFTGPDLLHYRYVDIPEYRYDGARDPGSEEEFDIDIQAFPEGWLSGTTSNYDWYYTPDQEDKYLEGKAFAHIVLPAHGFGKPKSFVGKRATPGKVQQAISDIIFARSQLSQLLGECTEEMDHAYQLLRLYREKVKSHDQVRTLQRDLLIADQVVQSVDFVFEVGELINDEFEAVEDEFKQAVRDAIPTSFIAGLAAGGDVTSGARAAIEAAGAVKKSVVSALKIAAYFAKSTLAFSTETAKQWVEFDQIEPLEFDQELKEIVGEVNLQAVEAMRRLDPINDLVRKLDDAERNLQSTISAGERVQAEREVFRRRAAALVQGFRTRDAAFRIFRSEKLERYKSLFDLASRYAFLAANAYDYETGLLDTTKGRAFVNRIVSSRSLGVMHNGEPQYAGSNTGDPGLSSALAEMKADWDVLKGRLGFNNPDAYGTAVSLRTENFRILPGTDGDQNWQDVLQAGRMANLLEDSDVRRYCMQLDNGNGAAVPGIILEFATTIADGLNLFGKPRAPGDHWYSPSSFATKIFSVGVALPGYVGMDNPAINAGAVTATGGVSPADPTISFLDGAALGATPHIYLIPVGVDSMRSPPLGDASSIRTWTIDDVTIPLPFNIGGSAGSTKLAYQSADSLSEELFAIRKHQAFRPVSSASAFTPSLYGSGGQLARSQFTNNRLIGRSVWNSRWKLIIPGTELLSNPKEGLDRFIRSVRDVKVYFVTYSYSGN